MSTGRTAAADDISSQLPYPLLPEKLEVVQLQDLHSSCQRIIAVVFPHGLLPRRRADPRNAGCAQARFITDGRHSAMNAVRSAIDSIAGQPAVTDGLRQTHRLVAIDQRGPAPKCRSTAVSRWTEWHISLDSKNRINWDCGKHWDCGRHAALTSRTLTWPAQRHTTPDQAGDPHHRTDTTVTPENESRPATSADDREIGIPQSVWRCGRGGCTVSKQNIGAATSSGAKWEARVRCCILRTFPSSDQENVCSHSWSTGCTAPTLWGCATGPAASRTMINMGLQDYGSKRYLCATSSQASPYAAPGIPLTGDSWLESPRHLELSSRAFRNAMRSSRRHPPCRRGILLSR